MATDTTLETLIDGLSRDQQIAAMEILWNRLTQVSDLPTPPQWHREIVAQRVEAVKNGTDTLVDWEDAKKHLADRLR